MRIAVELQKNEIRLLTCLQIGNEVLGNLAAQRETIGRSRDRLRGADAELNRSSKTLNVMIRR